MREIDEAKLDLLHQKISSAIKEVSETSDGAIPSEIVYAALAAVIDHVDDKSLDFVNFVSEAFSELIYAMDMRVVN